VGAFNPFPAATDFQIARLSVAGQVNQLAPEEDYLRGRTLKPWKKGIENEETD
jgi:hypothetical protein